jgi:hypothetical protein
MHFYWRIIEELKLIGESWTITDPSLQRNYQQWLRSNAEAISLSMRGSETILLRINTEAH